MSKELIYLMSFVLLLAVTGTASADQQIITIPDAGFDDHALDPGDYIYMGDSGYTGAWQNLFSGAGAWIDYGYYADDLPALSGNNKVYASYNADDYIYQILDETYVKGKTYTFGVSVGEPWDGYEDSWSLYFTGEDYTDELASIAGNGPIGEWGQASLVYTATAADAGKKIGIKLKGAEYVNFEDVTLSYFFDPAMAMNPSPANEQTDVPRDVTLSWTPGESAAPTNGHKVYFGESFNDVNDGIGGITQSVDSYDAGRLKFGTTYYWRVDEVAAPPASTVYPGDVWSFTAELLAYPIPGENITDTASSQQSNQEPEKTIDNSGLDPNDLHSANPKAMWISEASDPGSTWIQYVFDKSYKLHEMLVWNYNGNSLLTLYGLKEVTLEYSTDGTNWSQLENVPEFAQAIGGEGYAANTTVAFNGAVAKYVKITANSNWGGGGFFDQYGLSEVRFTAKPVSARKPSPDSGATDADLDMILGWRAGREAASHDVYFSDDLQVVIDGIEPVATVPEGSYGPVSLDVGTTYYWRVDEVNDAEVPSMWRGVIWDFSTVDSLVVDDFESYDAEENQIWWAWKDGLGYVAHGTEPTYTGNGTGAIVGDETTESFTEETIVHGGNQSMPLAYNNNKQGYLNYSEATLTLSSQRDWTVSGVKELSLWFRGYPASVGSFTEGPAGIYTMTGSGVDIWNTADEFHYAFKTLNGVGSMIAKVESVENTNVWAKAGVMIRETLEPGSAQAMMMVTPGEGVSFQRRPGTGDISFSDTTAGITAPYWVKIERDIAGNFTASSSSNGSAWQMVGVPQNIPMGTNVYIGLAVTSHDAALTCQAVFSNVTTTGLVGPQWMNQDIGIVSNDSESLYVAVSNNAGAPAVVVHDDPAAATIDTWTQWIIPLQAFADQGIVLTNVDSVAIGVGTWGNATIPGGSGNMFIDNIRLYRQIESAEE